MGVHGASFRVAHAAPARPVDVAFPSAAGASSPVVATVAGAGSPFAVAAEAVADVATLHDEPVPVVPAYTADAELPGGGPRPSAPPASAVAASPPCGRARIVPSAGAESPSAADVDVPSGGPYPPAVAARAL